TKGESIWTRAYIRRLSPKEAAELAQREYESKHPRLGSRTGGDERRRRCVLSLYVCTINRHDQNEAPAVTHRGPGGLGCISGRGCRNCPKPPSRQHRMP